MSKRTERALSAALADAAGATMEDLEFEAGAPMKMAIQLREELPMLCQGYAAKSVRSTEDAHRRNQVALAPWLNEPARFAVTAGTIR